MNIKQLFCAHIFELVKETYLHSTSIFSDFPKGFTTNHFALEWKCLKCGKIKITTTKRKDELWS